MPDFVTNYRKKGYDEDYIREKRNSQRFKNYERGNFSDGHSRKWMPYEDRLVLEHGITDRELARQLKRSVVAIQVRRGKLKNGKI